MAEPLSGSIDNPAVLGHLKHYSRPTQYRKRSQPQLFTDVTDQFTQIYQSKIDSSAPATKPSSPSSNPAPKYRFLSDDNVEPAQTAPRPSNEQTVDNNQSSAAAEPDNLGRQEATIQPQQINNENTQAARGHYQAPEQTLGNIQQPPQPPNPPAAHPKEQNYSAPIYENNYNGEYEDTKSRRLGVKTGLKKTIIIATTCIVVVAIAAAAFVWYMKTYHKNIVQAQANTQSGTTSSQSGNISLPAGANNQSAMNTSGGSGSSTANNQSAQNSFASTIAPSKAQVAAYTVGVSQPRYLIIPKLNIQSMILPVNLNSSNYLGAPNNIYNVGWWQSSSLPGQTGTVVLDGFTTNGSVNGVFASLSQLKPGDTLQVEVGSGSKATYQVVKLEKIGTGGASMDQAIQPVSPSTNGLNIITCTGLTLTCPGSPTQAFVVYTEQTQS